MISSIVEFGDRTWAAGFGKDTWLPLVALRPRVIHSKDMVQKRRRSCEVKHRRSRAPGAARPSAARIDGGEGVTANQGLGISVGDRELDDTTRGEAIILDTIYSCRRLLLTVEACVDVP